MNQKPPPAGQSRLLHAGRYIELRAVDTWEFASRVHRAGVVVLVAVTDADELLLVEQFRHPVNASVIELPAGLIGDEAGHEEESADEAGKRELLEETGYRCRELRPIYRCPTTAGLSDEMAIFMRAEGLERVGEGGGDDSEAITVHRVPLAGIDAWLRQQDRDGRLVDPKIFSALYWLANDAAGTARKAQ